MRASNSLRQSLVRPPRITWQSSVTTTRNPTLLAPNICRDCQRRIQERAASFPRSQRRFQSTSAAVSEAGPLHPSTPPQNHYEFFPRTLPGGPPPVGPFQVDLRALRKEFLQLQAKAHPDRHPWSLKARAEATSARINEAYKSLQSPLLRAQYCLSLKAIDVAEDETAKVQDPELLMTVMEVREAVEEAQEESELCELKAENDERIEESEQRISEGFDRGDLDAVKEETIRLRYWMNVKESLDHWEKGKGVILEH